VKSTGDVTMTMSRNGRDKWGFVRGFRLERGMQRCGKVCRDLVGTFVGICREYGERFC
jgi:hypothetical protein